MTEANTTLSRKNDTPMCRTCLEAMQAKQRATNVKNGRKPGKRQPRPMATTVSTTRHRYIRRQVDATMLKAARLPSPISVFKMNDQGEKVLVRTEHPKRK